MQIQQVITLRIHSKLVGTPFQSICSAQYQKTRKIFKVLPAVVPCCSPFQEKGYMHNAVYNHVTHAASMCYKRNVYVIHTKSLSLLLCVLCVKGQLQKTLKSVCLYVYFLCQTFFCFFARTTDGNSLVFLLSFQIQQSFKRDFFQINAALYMIRNV